jgi:hypothetical protein
MVIFNTGDAAGGFPRAAIKRAKAAVVRWARTRSGRTATAGKEMPSLLRLTSLLLLSSGCLAQQAGYGGYYVVGNPGQGGTAQRYFQSALSGSTGKNLAPGVPVNMRLNINWSQLETADGTYHWTTKLCDRGCNQSIDTYLYNAQQANQNIIVALTAGTTTPSWVITPISQGGAGAKAVTCDAYAAPLPWDATYLAKYNAAITALAAHLTAVSTPGGGTTNVAPWVKIVKLGGITNSTAELHVGVDSTTNYTNCPAGSLNASWAAAGFTPTNIKNAFSALLANYVKSFPTSIFTSGIVFSVDVIEVNAFPPIDDTGRLYIPPPGQNDELTKQILSALLANSAFQHSKFAVQWDALSNAQPAAQPLMSANQAKASGYNNSVVAWQLNERGGITNGSYCNYNGIFRPCDGTITGSANGDFERMVDTGVLHAATWIEFWGANISQLSAAVTNLRAKAMGLPPAPEPIVPKPPRLVAGP